MGQAVCTPRNRSIDYDRPDQKIVTDTMSNSPSIAVASTIKEQVAISTSIDNLLKKERHEDKTRVKILLLGGADAGKSTILKQMRILHMTGFSEHEMRSFHKNLRYNVIQIFHEISIGIHECGLATDDDEEKIICQFSGGFSCYRGINDDAEGGILHNFLDLNCVRTFMELYPNYASLPDNAHYYLPRLAELLSPDHVPTAEDILHLRIPTTSVNEINFSFSSSSIRLIDVGGQRTYRKKWIHCFDGVTAVLFVVSMAAYDQSLDEADTMITPVLHDDIILLATKKVHLPNRLRDSVQLFGEMLRSSFLSSASFILFLNKKDLFEKKVPNMPLNKYFKNYEGTTTEEASEFLKEHFLKRKSKKDVKRAIYSHYTCATDTKNVEFVFKAACDIVLQNNLHSQGM